MARRVGESAAARGKLRQFAEAFLGATGALHQGVPPSRPSELILGRQHAVEPSVLDNGIENGELPRLEISDRTKGGNVVERLAQLDRRSSGVGRFAGPIRLWRRCEHDPRSEMGQIVPRIAALPVEGRDPPFHVIGVAGNSVNQIVRGEQQALQEQVHSGECVGRRPQFGLQVYDSLFFVL